MEQCVKGNEQASIRQTKDEEEKHSDSNAGKVNDCQRIWRFSDLTRDRQEHWDIVAFKAFVSISTALIAVNLIDEPIGMCVAN